MADHPTAKLPVSAEWHPAAVVEDVFVPGRIVLTIGGDSAGFTYPLAAEISRALESAQPTELDLQLEESLRQAHERKTLAPATPKVRPFLRLVPPVTPEERADLGLTTEEAPGA
jgi:hypothetical protein